MVRGDWIAGSLYSGYIPFAPVRWSCQLVRWQGLLGVLSGFIAMRWHRFDRRCPLVIVLPPCLIPLWLRFGLYFCLLIPFWLRYGRPASPVPSFLVCFLPPGFTLCWLPLPLSTFSPSSMPIVGYLRIVLVFAGCVPPPNKIYVLLRTASWCATSSWRSLGTIRLRVEIFLIGQRCPSPTLVGSPASGSQAWFPCPGPGLGLACRCGEVAGKCLRWFVCLQLSFACPLDPGAMLPEPWGRLLGGQGQLGGSFVFPG
jgi:hypothetical protein